MNKNFENIELKEELKLNKYRGKIFVVKYGGSIMNNKVAKKTFIDDLIKFSSFGIRVVLVHGGGPKINSWIKKIGIENKTINGLRITNEETMEIVEMVLSGNVNKNLSFDLNGRGLKAIGLSGKDCDMIQAKRKYVYEGNDKLDIGFVGEVTKVNTDFLENLIKNEYIPVIAPIAGDNKGNTYNINADYMAAALSCALNAEKLFIMTDIEGVYKDIEDSASLIHSATTDEIKNFIEKGDISGGMIPKLECCIDAINNGTKDVHIIDGRKNHSLFENLFNINNCGTKIIQKREGNICQKII